MISWKGNNCKELQMTLAAPGNPDPPRAEQHELGVAPLLHLTGEVHLLRSKSVPSRGAKPRGRPRGQTRRSSAVIRESNTNDAPRKCNIANASAVVILSAMIPDKGNSRDMAWLTEGFELHGHTKDLLPYLAASKNLNAHGDDGIDDGLNCHPHQISASYLLAIST